MPEKSRSSVRAWEGVLVLPTYLPADPDRNPMFLEKRVYQGSSGRVYPLPFTDRVAETPVDREWKAAWIENEFLRVLVLPELGGRVHRILDKTNGYDLVYYQPVIKPALVGLAGPWISGGIEFNWAQHHRPATFLPVDCEIEEHPDGSKTIWCSDHDPMCRMKGMHGVCLHPGRAYVELKVRAYNRTPLTQTFLWWANVATQVHEAYQSFFPPDVTYVADHARRSMSEYPLAQGLYYGVNYGARARKGIPKSEVPPQFVAPHCRNESEISNLKSQIPDYAPNDLSFYSNIPVPTSYMCVGSKEDFFGGYDHKAGVGIVHFANHHIAPGKKQWTWGNHEFGYAWDRNLTDVRPDGEYPPYIEIMAGVYTDNQPDFSFLQPGETKTWSQYWYPIHKIGPARHANLDAAISLRQSAALRLGELRKTRKSEPIRGPALLRFGVSVTRRFAGARVVLLAKTKALFQTKCDLVPGAPFVTEIKLPRGVAESDLLLRVANSSGNEIISYQPRPRAVGQVPPPATEPPPPSDIASTDELYITGLHLDQYRHATRCPTLYWREALRRDPLDSRCNNAMGLWHFKRGEFETAEKHFRTAIARITCRNSNPYDGEPYYNLGLCLRFRAETFEKSETRNPKSERKPRTEVQTASGHDLRVSEFGHLSDLGLGTSDLFSAAYSSFYKATWNQAWAGAAYHALAEIDCRHGAWTTALNHLNRSLRFNTDNLRARNLKTVVLRKLNHGAEAEELLRETLALDPLDGWARQLNGEALQCDLQTHLDLAHDYARAGFYTEAIELLDRVAAGIHACRRGRASSRPEGTLEAVATRDISDAPGVSGVFSTGQRCADSTADKDARRHTELPNQSWGAMPLVNYTLGWLEQKHGNKPVALKHFKAAATVPSDYCFPARLEEIAVFEAALRANPRDAKAPYYLGNLLYDRRRHEEAIRLWENSAKLDPHFSIVWRNLGIGYFNIRKQPARARTAYDQAFRANPSDARLLYERDQLWKRLGVKPAKRLRELERHPRLIQQRDDLSLELCALYNQVGQHEKALALVSGRNFQPWEGGEGGPLGQWVRSHVAIGRAALRVAQVSKPAVSPISNRQTVSKLHSAASALRVGNPRYSRLETCATNAIEHFSTALTAPLNLGEAKHLLANQSEIHYWLGCAYEAAGETKPAIKYWRDAATFKGDFQEMSVRTFSETTYYSALAWRKLGKNAKASRLFHELLAYAEKLQKTEAKIDYFATSLPTMLLFEDDVQFRQETTALFLQAQAWLGLGRKSKARKLLATVLNRDPNHALAADLAGECTVRPYS